MTGTHSSYPTDYDRTAIAVGHKNEAYVADKVLPRIGVSKREYKYMSYPMEESFASPETRVGRRSAPNMVHLTAQESLGNCKDYGLQDAIPRSDVDNLGPGVRDPRDRSVMTLTDYLMITRERRVADMVFSGSSFPATNKKTLSSSETWSASTSTPVKDILNAIGGMVVKPNRILMGSEVWTKFRLHSDVLSSVGRSGTSNGAASRSEVAELFELDEVVVGQAWYNSSARGQTPSAARIWGKHALLYRMDPLADAVGPPTLGITAEYSPIDIGQNGLPRRLVTSGFNEDMGAYGSYVLKVVESLDEKIISSRAGFLFLDAIDG